MIAAVGRFGPYIRHNGTFYSLPKDLDPLKVTEDEAISIIDAKRLADKNKIIKTFTEDTDLRVLNGRFGPYISKEKTNYKIPKTQKPEELSYEDCLAIIDKEGTTKPVKKGKYAAKAKKK